MLYNLKEKDSVEAVELSEGKSRLLIEQIIKDRIPVASYLEYHGADRVKSLAIFPSMLLKPFMVRLYESVGGAECFMVNSIEEYRVVRDSIDFSWDKNSSLRVLTSSREDFSMEENKQSSLKYAATVNQKNFRISPEVKTIP